MAWLSRRALRPYLFPGIVLVVSLAASGVAALQIRAALAAQARDRFAAAADRLGVAILGRIDTYVAMLRAGAGAEAARGALTPEEFRRFVTRLEIQEQYPGIQGIGFTRRIRTGELQAVVQQQRQLGDTSFRVWPAATPAGYPEGERHAILYIEPLDRRNRAAVGYDMFSEPTRREAMARARDTGEPAASGAVTLVQEIDGEKQQGFLIYLPIYDGGDIPPTIEARRARLTGFIFSPFRAGDLLTGVLGAVPDLAIDFTLYDGAAGGPTLYESGGGAAAPDALSTTRSFEVEGRRWTAAITSAALPAGTGTAATPLGVMSGGAVIALLLTVLTWMQVRARMRAEASEAAVGEASARVQELLVRERAARAEAERVNRLKDEFLASLSHELRTPLNAVVGWAHIIQQGQLSPERLRHAVAVIERNAVAQSRLVEDLLDMSRIVSGRVQLEMQRLDLRDTVGAAVGVMRPTADTKGVRLQVALPADPVFVKGDPNRLQQVCWNLLSNAVKFTPAGGQVDVRLSTEHGHARLAVCDTGIGIDPAFLPHVFERFRQADASFARQHGGLGLGLSIAHSLAELHAGSLQAASDGANRGATFTLRLPMAARDDAVATRAVRLRSERLPADALRGRRILVVDDEADARELVAEVVTQCGGTAERVASAADALARLDVPDDGSSGVPATLPFDLIICDVAMPGMDGLSFVRTLRARGPASLPVLALTAHATEADRDAVLTAGFNRHLAKPVEPQALVEACTDLLAAEGSMAG